MTHGGTRGKRREDEAGKPAETVKRIATVLLKDPLSLRKLQSKENCNLIQRSIEL
jgi:hypothetical protein